ncbi:MAG: tRNA-dihydrouridine synthase family protein, partial [Clostridia bacterium]|nr:tRNA-dihydrouridine synthase family protein [Clostridia bacterium]
MAAYTDFAFRGICLKLGAGLSFTELVSAKGIVYDSPNTKTLLRLSGEEKIKAVQLFGSDPDIVYEACVGEDLAPFDVVDINMGCPVPKVYKNGEGSALLKDILKAESVVKSAVKSGKNVTAKIRIGISDAEPYVTEEYAKMIEG